jgi:AraC-like DNA-binding protein
MPTTQPYRFKTIAEYHRILNLPPPEHPLISLIDLASFTPPTLEGPVSVVFDFYSISLKRNVNAKFKYGQQNLDFDEGVLFFMSPGQVLGLEIVKEPVHVPSGWMILVHPDFLWNTALAKLIHKYEYFSYSVNEALYLSEKEENTITGIIKNIEQEYHNNIDKFSQDIIISQLEVLLNYSERFYNRQFITRKITNHKILDRLEDVLTTYFKSEDLTVKGLPTVQFIAEELNISPNYLSGMLKVLTGQTTQQHIQNKLIERAKERLSTTNLSVSEIAYELGIEHSQSFSRLFKTKTKLSPLEFRAAFN